MIAVARRYFQQRP